LTLLKSPQEGALLIQDLLTEPEADMLAKRLAIAGDLLDGARYEEIQKKYKASPPTIARISEWLSESGQGFGLIWTRQRSKKRVDMQARRLKRGRPSVWSMYHWPAILITELIEHADAAQKERLSKIFEKLDGKSELYKEIEPYIRKLRW
jgi:uncharacterized protein YerC